MENKVGIVLTIIILLSSSCFAEISPVTIEDCKDHGKLVDKLNQIISRINVDKADKKEIQAINTHYLATASELNALRGNLSQVRANVGDPTGTVADVRAKFIKLMDTLDGSVISQHTKVTP